MFRDAARWLVVLACVCAGVMDASAQVTPPVPNPPGSGPFAIQFYVGGMKYTYMTLNLPTTFTDDTPIPLDTSIQLKIYRWDWSRRVWDAVTLESGTGEGPYGSGGFGMAGRSVFISFIAVTPVDCIEPRVVVLGATATINGIESAMVTDDLSFRYASSPPAPPMAGDTRDCIPILVRFGTPEDALPPDLAPPPDSGPGGIRRIPALRPTVRGTRIGVRTGAAGRLDLIFVIDQTSSMSSVFKQVQMTAKEMLRSIASVYPDYRVAIVAYRDWGDTEMFRDFAFSNDPAAITAAIDGLSAAGGGDQPEAVLEALLRALRMPWRPGVNKQIILMGDAGPHSPVPQGEDKGATAADVAKLAFEVDPAVINTIATPISGVVNKDTMAAFSDLAARTKGTATTADKAEEVPKKIMDVVSTMAGSPTGGGGGAPVLPETGLNVGVLGVVTLVGGCLVLLVAILLLRDRGGRPTKAPRAQGPGPKVHAGLSIRQADGRVNIVRLVSVRTTIGRGVDNDVVVADDQVSVRHAEIVASRDGFLLRDLHSSNGTRVNGQSVVEASLRLHDEVTVGKTVLTLTD